MRLNLNELKNREIWKGYKLFSFDYEKVKQNTKERPRWIHFGAGNIFRIFPAALCQKLLNENLIDTGIIVAEGFNFDIIDKIYKPHDNLTLAVTLKADGSIEKEVIASVTESLKCDPTSPDWKDLESAFKNPSLQFASFTITEKGYALYNQAGELFKPYQQDFTKSLNEASMLLCNIVRLLNERFLSSKAPIALVSMDNCSHNGEKLRSALITISKAYVDNGSLSKEFLSYIEDEALVSFPWSMIDKITPRPDSGVAESLKADGFESNEAIVTSKNTYIAPYVNAEGPQYLVIEDRFPNGRPPLEKSGVYFTDRETVNKVEKMKVCTCLNPLHTALALSGCLLGYNLIANEMKDPDLKKLVEILGYKEGLPVVVDPKILDPKKFIDEVLQVRIPNPFMPDTPQRIATDTSQKLSIRFGETVKAYIKDPNLDVSSLKVVPLIYALYIRYLFALDDEGNEFTLSPDPMTESLKPHLDKFTLGSKITKDDLLIFLTNEKLFGVDLTKTLLSDRVVTYVQKLCSKKGAVRETIHEVVSRY